MKLGAVDWNKVATASSAISQGVQTISTSIQPFVNPVRNYTVNQVLQQPVPGAADQPKASSNHTWVYVGVGVGLLAIGGTIFYFSTRKK